MKYKVTTEQCLLRFKRPATTSRGAYNDRLLWLVRVCDPQQPDVVGLGECAPLPDLSIDDRPDYTTQLAKVARIVAQTGELPEDELVEWPSIRFGLESALQHLRAGGFAYWDNPFTRGEEGIPFNGLVWMGGYERMQRELADKIAQGFRCIKLKIGAIDFEQELNLMRYIRDRYCAEELEIRVDANGAFTVDDAMRKLEALAQFDLHSIEQPIKAGQWQVMAQLAKSSPVPIALDEELIPCQNRDMKVAMIETIMPQYLVIKPSLHGGLSGGDEWKGLARQHHIGYWATSALESNVGLNAIAQWTAREPIVLPQGLGTGELFVENLEVPIERRGTKIFFKV